MNFVDSVDLEGGPLLIGDASLVRLWSGSDNRNDGSGGSDYEAACDVTTVPGAGATYLFATGSVFLWDIEGPGTCDVFRDDATGIVVMRGWYEDATIGEQQLTAVASLPIANTTPYGSFDVQSGVLVFIWSAENGEAVHCEPFSGHSRPTVSKMMTSSSGLMLQVPNGTYDCSVDRVFTEGEQDEAIRLFLTLR